MSDENFEEGESVGDSASASRKMYYTISEVCRMTGVEAHALRYWEEQFRQLRPKKNSSGNRAYREKDIEVVLRIKRLIHEEKYTISGAKQKLADERREEKSQKRGTGESGNRYGDGSGDDDTRAMKIVDANDHPDQSAQLVLPISPSRQAQSIHLQHLQDNALASVDSELISGVRDELKEILAMLES